MATSQETLRRIQSLEQLYRSGYHSEAIDSTIDKLMAMERARVGQELTRLEERLRQFEQQYQLDSAAFHAQFDAGELGDEADFFEWSAFYRMWLSTQEQLKLLKAPVA